MSLTFNDTTYYLKTTGTNIGLFELIFDTFSIPIPNMYLIFNNSATIDNLTEHLYGPMHYYTELKYTK